MSITPSTMKCPVCEEQTLESLSTSLGTFEQCPNCQGLFLSQDLLASASLDRAKTLEALEETKILLLPTEKWCPKCMQKLFEGRVRSRGVILTLCPACLRFWTDLSILADFDQALEKTLSVQIELANSTRSSESASLKSASGTTSIGTLYEDSGVGSLFRTFARMLNRWADHLSAEPSAPRKEKVKPPKPQPKKAEKKSIILDVQPEIAQAKAKAPPPTPPKETVKEPEPLPQPPKIDVPEFIFPEEAKAEPERESEPIPAPPEPIPVPPKPAPASEPMIFAKPVPSSKEGQPGFFGKLKSAWIPAPKKSAQPVKPVLPVKPVQPAIPIQPVRPAKAIDVPQPKPEGSFGKKLAAFFAPKPRPKPTAKPSPPQVVSGGPVAFRETTPLDSPLKTAGNDVNKNNEPSMVIEPPKPAVEVKKPAPAPKPAPIPKPKKVKAPKDPIDHLAVWPPWVLAILGVACSAFRDFGFEAGPAVLWGIAGWSIGSMIRLFRLYRDPVTLTGQIVLADELKPKGEVVLKVDDKTILLNRLGTWDVIPRLFGLSNPRQLMKGAVTLKGWYRGILVPSFEVDEIKAEKTIRRSMVKTLRWASAIFIGILAVVIYVSLE